MPTTLDLPDELSELLNHKNSSEEIDANSTLTKQREIKAAETMKARITQRSCIIQYIYSA